MTSDVRTLLHTAAEADELRFSGAEDVMRRGLRLRWYRRLQLALPLIVVAALGLVLTRPDLPILDDAQRIAPAHPGQLREPARPKATPGPLEQSSESERQVEASTPRRRPATSPAPREATAPREPGSVQRSAAVCSPVIDDPRGDVEDPSLDIVSSSISYSRAGNTMTVEHLIDDIVFESPSPELIYDMHFRWDGLNYHAQVWVGEPAYPGEVFASIFREPRAGSATDGWLDNATIATPTGRIDPASDTVTMEVSLDEFNDGEKAASKEEGMPPPAQLKEGSTLTGIDLITRGGPLGNSPNSDTASASCDYVIGS